MQIHAKAWMILIFICASCGNTPNRSSDNGGTLQKIVITPSQVYDLSGYSGEGGGSPFNLFDENAFVDPRNEKPTDAFVPVTNCQPTIHPAIYFQRTEGNRIVVDLKIPYSIKEIYIFDRSLTADSFWIYSGDLKKWKKIVSLVTVSQSGNWGWKKIILDEETRFVMMRFSSYETAVTEIVFYGIPRQAIPPADNFSIHKGFTQTSLNQFLGVNYIMEHEPRWLKPFHYSRLYNFALDFDNDANRDERNVRFNMLYYGYYNKEKRTYIFDIDTLQHINQGNIWFSIRGVSKWMSDLHFSDKDRPINMGDLNPEDPASYSRHAKMMWHIAAFFGFNQVDTNLLSLSHKPLQSGRGSMNIFENGNEEDANWAGNKYCSPVEYFAQSSADWDGDEGRLGARHGIHNADSQSRLMMSGLIGLDTNRVKVYRFLAKNLRDDQNFIWQGGIQYHYYSQNGKRGISPEEDSMRWKLAKAADCSFRIAPAVKCFLGENGYDKSPVSRQATPMIPGLSASQSQGIMLLRSINATFFSGFDAYILYWLRDANPEDDPRVYLTSGILRTMPDGKTKVFPGWYYISTLVNQLGKYRPDKIIKESGDIWIYRYRHTEQPDSVAYFIYKPTVNGSRVVSFTLETGAKDENVASKISFLEDSEMGKKELLKVKDGKIKLTIEEKPILLMCKEPIEEIIFKGVKR
jgi:hypothetical protein